MIVPYSLVVIKPLSVGRGNAPDILNDILTHCPVALRLFRVWAICSTTMDALHHSDPDAVFPPITGATSWICVFTHLDRTTDPADILAAYFGDRDRTTWIPGQLRYQYGGYRLIGVTARMSDDVVHLSLKERTQFEANLLFSTFDENKI